jgi:hypothetical protein
LFSWAILKTSSGVIPTLLITNQKQPKKRDSGALGVAPAAEPENRAFTIARRLDPVKDQEPCHRRPPTHTPS